MFHKFAFMQLKIQTSYVTRKKYVRKKCNHQANKTKLKISHTYICAAEMKKKEIIDMGCIGDPSSFLTFPLNFNTLSFLVIFFFCISETHL